MHPRGADLYAVDYVDADPQRAADVLGRLTLLLTRESAVAVAAPSSADPLAEQLAQAKRELEEKEASHGKTGRSEEELLASSRELLVLQKRYLEQGSAFTLQELAKGYILTTRPEHDGLLGQLVREREAQKLSPATLEALAIIAYKQPIGRGELDNIRGAGSDHLVRNLLDRGLIKVTERDSSKGNAALYGTTAEFLRAFGLRSISELPTEGDLAAPADGDTEGDNDGPTIEEAEVSAPDDD